ncbi:MAG: NAD(P)H-binding protein, partial [Myxococcota bacterium]
MHVFLTGGTGYIGSAVARALLARGDSVTALVRSEQSRSRLLRGVTAVPGDLDHPTDWLRHLPDHDALIHTAFPQHGRAWGEAVEIEQRFLSLLLTSPDVSKMPVIVSNGSIFLGDSGTDRLNESAPIEDDHPAASRAQSVERIQALERGVELRLASFVYGNGGSVFIPILLNYARAHRRSLLVKGHEYVRRFALSMPQDGRLRWARTRSGDR